MFTRTASRAGVHRGITQFPSTEVSRPADQGLRDGLLPAAQTTDRSRGRLSVAESSRFRRS